MLASFVHKIYAIFIKSVIKEITWAASASHTSEQTINAIKCCIECRPAAPQFAHCLHRNFIAFNYILCNNKILELLRLCGLWLRTTGSTWADPLEKLFSGPALENESPRSANGVTSPCCYQLCLRASFSARCVSFSCAIL